MPAHRSVTSQPSGRRRTWLTSAIAGDNDHRHSGCQRSDQKEYGLVDDQVRVLRLVLAAAQVVLGSVMIGGALHDRHQPPAARKLTRSPRWSLIAGSVLAFCGMASVLLLAIWD
jgi:hypothetical protein